MYKMPFPYLLTSPYVDSVFSVKVMQEHGFVVKCESKLVFL